MLKGQSDRGGTAAAALLCVLLPTIDPHANAARIKERYYRNFAVDPRYAPRIDGGGMRIAGCDDQREIRMIEPTGQPFRWGAIVAAQLRSPVAGPGPLIAGFLKTGLS
jgi:CTP synthase (UTP-ammonia lyase)